MPCSSAPHRGYRIKSGKSAAGVCLPVGCGWRNESALLVRAPPWVPDQVRQVEAPVPGPTVVTGSSPASQQRACACRLGAVGGMKVPCSFAPHRGYRIKSGKSAAGVCLSVGVRLEE